MKNKEKTSEIASEHLKTFVELVKEEPAGESEKDPINMLLQLKSLLIAYKDEGLLPHQIEIMVNPADLRIVNSAIKLTTLTWLITVASHKESPGFDKISESDLVGAARIYVENGGDLEMPSGDFGCTALHFAVAYNLSGLTRELIKLGADIQAKDKDNNSPLHWAALHSHKEAAGELILAGASLTAANIDKKSPPEMAASHRGEDFANWLHEVQKVLKERKELEASMVEVARHDATSNNGLPSKKGAL